MNEIQVFQNEQFGTVRIIDEDGKILFCGKDVATALGYSRPNDAITKHCKGTLKRRITSIGDTPKRRITSIILPCLPAIKKYPTRKSGYPTRKWGFPTRKSPDNFGNPRKFLFHHENDAKKRKKQLLFAKIY